MGWKGSSPSRTTLRNQARRGQGPDTTWGQENRNLSRAERREGRWWRGRGRSWAGQANTIDLKRKDQLRQELGRNPSWGAQSARVARNARRREREERRARNPVRRFFGI